MRDAAQTESKPTYAPFPLRALADLALCGADLRVLGAVAAHDRFAKNKTGCFASYKRLAAMTGLAIETLKRSVGKLMELGYLRSEANPMDARRRVLFVEYNEADAAAMRGDGRSFTKPARLKLAPAAVEIGDEMVTDSPAAECIGGPVESPEIGDELVTDSGEIGDRRKCQVIEVVDRSATNIFCEADKRSRETPPRNEELREAPPDVTASAGRAVKDAISGKIDGAEAVDRLRRALGRMRAYGDVAGEARVKAMIDAVARDAPPRKPAPTRLFEPLASPMEARAIREAAAAGKPPPGWVRAGVRCVA
jgi:hypothetical protein